MSYQVLARKYRPQTFADLVGQDHVVQTLSNSIAIGRVAHAFLFVGPRGIGKTSTARILAKALNAPGGPNVNFDPNEESIREIAEGRSMDVIEIDGASNNNVEQIRELRDNVQYAPTRGNFKIYIIDEVHMLTTQAFNALLKTLEEPPAHVKFIFATTEAHKVLPTILSRCQRFDLKRISDQDIAKQLQFIAEQEKIEVEPRALTILARNAEGGMRDAESAFDQLISFCGGRITEKDVLEVFGLTGYHEIWNLAEAVQAGQADLALAQVRDLVARGKDLSRLTQEMLRTFRNQLLFVISPEMAKKELDETEFHHFEALKPLPSQAGILALIEELVGLEEKIRYALVKEVLFEIAMIRMCQQREKVALEEIIRAVLQGEGGATIPVPDVAPPAAIAPRTSPTPSPATPTPEPSTTKHQPAPVEEVKPEVRWETLVSTLRTKDATMEKALRDTRVLSCTRQRLEVVLNTDPETYHALVNSNSCTLIEKEVEQAFGSGTRLKLSLAETASATAQTVKQDTSETAKKEKKTAASSQPSKEKPSPAPDSSSKGSFENDPKIREALEAFKGRIVEIRAKL